eukprot:TRINITY_DN241_c0_g1_i1.p1 TRINITY_DN241_c0_g1~~TRINITY_DN241_c0_g1_i1.p1  ORF type:complete len:872 (-),score=82.92 TRINITY_DN241_c0_g1_i1:226-2841(-)
MKRIHSYVLFGSIGSGSYAAVYAACEKSKLSADNDGSLINQQLSNAPLAVKVIQKSSAQTPWVWRGILREVAVMQSPVTCHPNLLHATDVFCSRRQVYVVMPNMTGGTLLDFVCSAANRRDASSQGCGGSLCCAHATQGALAECPMGGGGLPEAEAAGLFWQVLRAVARLHAAGVAHRDIKPENVLLQPTPTSAVDAHAGGPQPWLAVLADYGLVSPVSARNGAEVTSAMQSGAEAAAAATRADGAPGPHGGKALCHSRLLVQTCCGTPMYTAPEVASAGAAGYDAAAADIWSLGVLLHAAVTSTLPFQLSDAPCFDDVTRLQPDNYRAPRCLSAPLRELLAQLLQGSPKRRPTVSDVLQHRWVAEGVCQWRETASGAVSWAYLQAWDGAHREAEGSGHAGATVVLQSAVDDAQHYQMNVGEYSSDDGEPSQSGRKASSPPTSGAADKALPLLSIFQDEVSQSIASLRALISVQGLPASLISTLDPASPVGSLGSRRGPSFRTSGRHVGRARGGIMRVALERPSADSESAQQIPELGTSPQGAADATHLPGRPAMSLSTSGSHSGISGQGDASHVSTVVSTTGSAHAPKYLDGRRLGLVRLTAADSRTSQGKKGIPSLPAHLEIIESSRDAVGSCGASLLSMASAPVPQRNAPSPTHAQQDRNAAGDDMPVPDPQQSDDLHVVDISVVPLASAMSPIMSPKESDPDRGTAEGLRGDLACRTSSPFPSGTKATESDACAPRVPVPTSPGVRRVHSSPYQQRSPNIRAGNRRSWSFALHADAQDLPATCLHVPGQPETRQGLSLSLDTRALHAEEQGHSSATAAPGLGLATSCDDFQPLPASVPPPTYLAPTVVRRGSMRARRWRAQSPCGRC